MHGTGEDAVGIFVPDGELVQGIGQMKLRNIYVTGLPVWTWACLMTPVAIVGPWGERQVRRWIWVVEDYLDCRSSPSIKSEVRVCNICK